MDFIFNTDEAQIYRIATKGLYLYIIRKLLGTREPPDQLNIR